MVNFVNGTLVNSGDQVYSGTIAGSPPVMIHDDQFRFEVNLVTGTETGQVFLFNHVAGPKVRCQLEVIGAGVNADGNPAFNYSGECNVSRPIVFGAVETTRRRWLETATCPSRNNWRRRFLQRSRVATHRLYAGIRRRATEFGMSSEDLGSCDNRIGDDRRQLGRLLVEERPEPIQVGESINRPLQLY